jgi:hypothetical protein
MGRKTGNMDVVHVYEIGLRLFREESERIGIIHALNHQYRE